MEIVDLKYTQITELVLSLVELYKNANDKTVIDEFIKRIYNPLIIIDNDVKYDFNYE